MSSVALQGVFQCLHYNPDYIIKVVVLRFGLRISIFLPEILHHKLKKWFGHLGGGGD